MVQFNVAHAAAGAGIVKNLTPLKAMFATAVEDGALQSNPTQGVRVNGRRDESNAEPEARAVTRVELVRVQAALPEQWRLFFDVLAQTGVRISEELGFDWEDLELGARLYLRVRREFYRGDLRRLRTHNGRRDLPLSSRLARWLWVARPANGAGPMFHTRNGTRLSDRNVRRVLDPATVEVGVPRVSFHNFRHTCASMLFDSGKNVRQDVRLARAWGPGVHAAHPSAWGNAGATQHPQTAATDDVAQTAEVAI